MKTARRAYHPGLEAQARQPGVALAKRRSRTFVKCWTMIVAEMAEEGEPLPANVAASEEPLVTVTV